MGGRNHNAADWTRMTSKNASIDSFIANSMEYIRTHRFDGIDLDWNFPAFCEGPDRCSPPRDALRFKILLERFRAAIESENVPLAKKFIISSSAGPKQNQIYGTTASTTTPPATTTTKLAATAISSVTTALANGIHISTNITETPDQMTDLKIEIWSPIVAVVALALIIFLIVYSPKRKNAKIFRRDRFSSAFSLFNANQQQPLQQQRQPNLWNYSINNNPSSNNDNQISTNSNLFSNDRFSEMIEKTSQKLHSPSA